LLTVGATGFRFLNPGFLAPETSGLLNSTLRSAFPLMVSIADTSRL
jgi:hypothetical protein